MTRQLVSLMFVISSYGEHYPDMNTLSTVSFLFAIMVKSTPQDDSLKEIYVPTPLGIKIRQLRKEQGLSLDQLAAMAETSKSYLWELENRETANPTMDKVSKIAEKLGVTAEFLLNDKQEGHSVEDADKAFFRKYQKLPSPTKKKIQDILNVIQDRGTDDE